MESMEVLASVEIQTVLFPGHFVSIFGKASTVHAQCCVVVVVIVVRIDITVDVYNYRPLVNPSPPKKNKPRTLKNRQENTPVIPKFFIPVCSLGQNNPCVSEVGGGSPWIMSPPTPP